MDISSWDISSWAAAIIFIVGVLVFLTNIVVEVLKKATWDKLPTNILALVIAIVMTLTAFICFAKFMSIQLMWWYFPPVIMLGFAVAYAAMFGFDKFKETLLQWKNNIG